MQRRVLFILSVVDVISGLYGGYPYDLLRKQVVVLVEFQPIHVVDNFFVFTFVAYIERRQTTCKD